MVNLTYGSPLFAVTGSFICAKFYHFNLHQTGLFLGVPLTVGCLIGEFSAGWVSDLILNTYAKRHDGYRKVEVRLWLLPLTATCAIGTATFGYCIQHHKPWIQAAVCMAVSGYGTQVIATMVYTYCCDSYKPQSSEISVIINVFKSRKFLPPTSPSHSIRDASIQSLHTKYTVFAFNIGFYGLPTADRIGFTGGFGLFGAISALTLLLPLFLIFFGERIRKAQGVPKEPLRLVNARLLSNQSCLVFIALIPGKRPCRARTSRILFRPLS
jgi:hypothetical protein